MDKTFTAQEIMDELNKIREAYSQEPYAGKDMPVAYIIGEIENDLDLT